MDEPPRTTTCGVWLRVGDVTVSMLIITPLTLLWWSGSWKALDLYLLPDNSGQISQDSSYISLGVGLFISIGGYFLTPLLGQCIQARCSKTHVLVSRIFIYFYAAGILNFWRGVWNISDNLLGKDLTSSCVYFATSHCTLIVFRATSNSLGPPYTVVHDHRPDFYETFPRFRTKFSVSSCREFITHTADVIFSHSVIHTLNIQEWRAVWNILDNTILPHDKLTSYYVCLATGFVSILLIFAIEYPLNRASKAFHQKHWLLELVLENVVHLFAMVAQLFLWRGGWGLMKDYVIVKPNDKIHCWIYHGVGMGVLMLLNCASTMAPVGCGLDGENAETQGFMWPIHSVSTLHQAWESRRTSPRGLNVQGSDSVDSESDESAPLLGGSDSQNNIVDA